MRSRSRATSGLTCCPFGGAELDHLRLELLGERLVLASLLMLLDNETMAPQADPANPSADASDMKDLVVGTMSYDETLLAILPRSVVQHLADVFAALDSSTWGELRRTASVEIYKEILGLAGYGSVDEFPRS